jgi:uncharacterized protein (DUF433 family)
MTGYCAVVGEDADNGKKDYLEHISIDPNIRFGKPCIRNTRISIGDILGWLAAGMSIPEMLEDFPELNEVHIRAALAFAANREESIRMVTQRLLQRSVCSSC